MGLSASTKPQHRLQTAARPRRSEVVTAAIQTAVQIGAAAHSSCNVNKTVL